MTPQQIVYKSKSWRDFESRISSLPYKERGTAFEWFCKFYLLTNPVYKLTYKKVLHSSESVNEYPNRLERQYTLIMKHNFKQIIVQILFN